MKRTLVFALAANLAASLVLHGQGSLTPPGAPAPTMKALDQIEPRTPVFALPYAINSSGAYYLMANLTMAAAANGGQCKRCDRLGELLLLKAENPKHRNIETPKHRNTETPKHRDTETLKH
jgi:hypothetical protein